jgi:hypothetical protein
MIKPSGPSGNAAPPEIVIIQHWTEELKRRVPVE